MALDGRQGRRLQRRVEARIAVLLIVSTMSRRCFFQRLDASVVRTQSILPYLSGLRTTNKVTCVYASCDLNINICLLSIPNFFCPKNENT